MVCGIKISKVIFLEEFPENNFQKNSFFFSNSDGELLSQMNKLNGLKFTKKENYIKLEGSLHLFHNNGTQNYDEFTYSKICKTIDHLISTKKIDAKKSIINNIEFGVNIELPFPVSLILNKIVTFKGSPFSHEKNLNINSRVCKNSQIHIKMYDKGLQFDLNKNLLRFEVKIKRMQFHQNKGIDIRNLADLKIYRNYPKVIDLIKSIFDEILFEEDNFDQRLLSTKDLIFYLRIINPNYWLNSQNQSAAEKKKMNREKIKYKSLIEKNCIGKPYSYLISDEINIQLNKLLKN
ncbi:MAG TPA: hypothetical protein VK175_15695 [Leadbetterella sp.]|nr:hypothetical protein [Leadbetterella sp.]